MKTLFKRTVVVSKPVVLNKKTAEPGNSSVYIGRPSKWGNPFPLKSEKDRVKVIDQYADYLVKNPELMHTIGELEGKNLVCWCAPKICHGHVLLYFANTNIRLLDMPEDIRQILRKYAIDKT